MGGKTLHRLEERKQDVVVAAQEERDAHSALVEGRGPLDPDWSEEKTEDYRARLDRWRNASRALAEALDRVERAQRDSIVREEAQGEPSATS